MCGDELVEGPVAFIAGKSIVAKLKSNDRVDKARTSQVHEIFFCSQPKSRMKILFRTHQPTQVLVWCHHVSVVCGDYVGRVAFIEVNGTETQ